MRALARSARLAGNDLIVVADVSTGSRQCLSGTVEIDVNVAGVVGPSGRSGDESNLELDRHLASSSNLQRRKACLQVAHHVAADQPGAADDQGLHVVLLPLGCRCRRCPNASPAQVARGVAVVSRPERAGLRGVGACRSWSVTTNTIRSAVAAAAASSPRASAARGTQAASRDGGGGAGPGLRAAHQEAERHQPEQVQRRPAQGGQRPGRAQLVAGVSDHQLAPTAVSRIPATIGRCR